MNIEDVITHHEIHTRLIQFARGMDNRDWAGLATILSDDATADYGNELLCGSAAIISSIRSYLDPCGTTQHLLGNLLVQSDGEYAESHCYVSDMHLGTGDRAHVTFCTLGDYHDRWHKRDGEWRMVHREKDHRGYIGTQDFFDWVVVRSK